MNGISVNTNSGALKSLQYLNMTSAGLNMVQNAVNSGMTVADAKDNGAVYAIAQNMRGDVAGYNAVSGSLSRGTSSVDVALSAGQSISDLLIQMKSQALAASDSSLDTASRQALNENFQALLGQITSVVQNAQFNGVNLIDGSTKQITALASTDGSHRITVSAENMSLSGSVVTIASTGSISTQSKASTMISTVEASLTNVELGAVYSFERCREVFNPVLVCVPAVVISDRRHRQPCRRRHGHGKCAVECLAG